jgi:hypothetical protein
MNIILGTLNHAYILVNAGKDNFSSVLKASCRSVNVYQIIASFFTILFAGITAHKKDGPDTIVSSSCHCEISQLTKLKRG